MPIKTYRPTTPTRRFQTVVSCDDITKDRPEKSLVESKKRTGGRSSNGRTTSRFIGGGSKKAYRMVDFKRDKAGVPAVVAAIEYDPNRSARIALLNYADGEKRYIIQPDGLKVGQKVMSGPEADILVGNAMPMKNMPAGTIVHNIELRPGKGAQMARSAGSQAQLVSKEGGTALLKLPSGEVRGREAVQGESRRGPYGDFRRKVAPPRPLFGLSLGLEEGLRQAEGRGEGPRLRGGLRKPSAVSRQLTLIAES